MMKSVKVVGAIIENDRDEILCAKRSKTMTLPNLWEFPGGKIEEHETPEEALIREISEELDCTITVFDQVEDTTHTYDSIIVQLITFKARITNGTPVAREHAELRWVHHNKLTVLEWAAADIPAVEKLVQMS
ncbi:(deoxy)nucleoside triphosphate pyrophosphohydrolase [Bacillus solimangrovi]|uniref:8-oxo-dGTP diphosphatase n=1 Tax=Bacillus solimangrovi TaxID=1305675 RepID=A0A1E5LAG1_9BACI|nr:(deoxy)nucleoside triphosphate pyrophosphohydrolase [Bacillus solimangrovi]OEH91050.1 DNA mismatch repair protein MutT [Bacillus solimangrovi]